MQRYRAACSASRKPVAVRLDVHPRRPVDCFWGVDFNVPARAAMRARCRPIGFGRLGEQVLNTPVSGWLMHLFRYRMQGLLPAARRRAW